MQASFANGIKAIMDAMPKALETMKDPTMSTKALSKLLDNGGEEMKVRARVCSASGGEGARPRSLCHSLTDTPYHHPPLSEPLRRGAGRGPRGHGVDREVAQQRALPQCVPTSYVIVILS